MQDLSNALHKTVGHILDYLYFVVSFIFETFLVCFMFYVPGYGDCPRSHCTKVNQRIWGGKKFLFSHEGYWVSLNKHANPVCYKESLRSDISSYYCVVKWVKNKPFFQPIHLDVINESFMHNVPKGKVLACISNF